MRSYNIDLINENMDWFNNSPSIMEDIEMEINAHFAKIDRIEKILAELENFAEVKTGCYCEIRRGGDMAWSYATLYVEYGYEDIALRLGAICRNGRYHDTFVVEAKKAILEMAKDL